MLPLCSKTLFGTRDVRWELVYEQRARRGLGGSHSQIDPRGVTLWDFGLLVENFGMVGDE